MLNSSVLDIGIGLVMTYLMLSLIVTSANELVATVLRSRAIDLERGIRNLLDGNSQFPERWWTRLWNRFFPTPVKSDEVSPTAANSSEPNDESKKPDDNPTKPTKPGDWSNAFFKHPLINSFSKDDQMPCYVPSQTFATVLLVLAKRAATSILVPEADPAAANGTDSVSSSPDSATPTTNPGTTTQTQASGTANTKTNDSVKLLTKDENKRIAQESPNLASHLSGEASFDDIRSVIEKIQNDHIKSLLLPLLEVARSDSSEGISELKKFTNQIEHWYDDAMNRVTGWYVQRTRIFLFLIAAVFATALNIDTVAICRQLGTNSTLRDSIVESAKQYTSQAANKPDGDKKQTPADLETSLKNVETDVGKLNSLGIPLGWNKNELALPVTGGGKPANGSIKYAISMTLILTKIAGLLMTIFAASLGAPFWFDVLNKFMSVRGTGIAPHEKPKPLTPVPQSTPGTTVVFNSQANPGAVETIG